MKRIKHIALYLLMTAILVVQVYPIFWIFMTSLKTAEEVRTKSTFALPSSLCFDNYVRAVTTSDLALYFKNSLIVLFITITALVLLSSTAAFVGSVLNLKPVLTPNKECSRLDKFGIGRTMKGAVKAVFRQMKKDQVGKEDILYIAHGNVPEDALAIEAMAKEEFPGIDIRIHLLSHVFITQGGPGCVALQHIRR